MHKFDFLVLLQAEHPTKGDQLKEGHALVLTPLIESTWLARDRRRGWCGMLPSLWRSTAFSWKNDNTFNPKYMKMAVCNSQDTKTHCHLHGIGKHCLGKSLFVTEFLNITACGIYSYQRDTNGEGKEATNNCLHNTGCPVRVRTEHRLKTCLCVICTTSKLPVYWLALIRILDGPGSNFCPQTIYFIWPTVSRTEQAIGMSFYSIPKSFRIILL